IAAIADDEVHARKRPRVFAHHVLVPPQSGRRMAVRGRVVDLVRDVEVALAKVHRDRGPAGEAREGLADCRGDLRVDRQARRSRQYLAPLQLARPIGRAQTDDALLAERREARLVEVAQLEAADALPGHDPPAAYAGDAQGVPLGPVQVDRMAPALRDQRGDHQRLQPVREAGEVRDVDLLHYRRRSKRYQCRAVPTTGKMTNITP